VINPFTLRPVEPERDADVIHGWVTQERAGFWGMQDADRERVVEIYSWIAEQPHLAAYLVHHDGTPLALFQTYDPAVDEIGAHYDRRPGDLGVHILLADDPARAGRTKELMAFLLGYCFADPAVQRLVVEPDVRNTRAVALVERIGGELGPVVDELPMPGGGTKPAQFAVLERTGVPLA
jgi:penicillin amidase